YDVNDSAGNAATQVTRTVTVTADATPPVITLTGSDVSIELGTAYTDEGATASDNIDGDITANIVTVNPVDINTVGVYTVTYDVNDSAGNAATQVTRTVTVTADATPPVITLIGNTPIDVWQGSTYIDDGATAVDNIDGNITGNIVTVNPVDTDVLGQYTVTYDVNDSAGNAATQVTRIVNVVDGTIPIITLLGDTPINVLKGSVYIDAGATAVDNVDGNITGNIVTVNPVDTDVLGQYIVTYDVNDSAGNEATQVTRTVNVVEDTSIDTVVANSSGGGCTYNPNSKNFDMTFLLMIALGLFYPFRRRFIK
ncbi:immunoglobulin-like domain-containing protein, partial [Sulfurovum sp. TSL6]|uniref:immunoglobulin-like domain-containing protein n=1 Tax=Sulfurovum sp. TSL6 TaxID=2826995 RepID=UPI001CC7FCF6